jgi:hypothetical protein
MIMRFSSHLFGLGSALAVVSGMACGCASSSPGFTGGGDSGPDVSTAPPEAGVQEGGGQACTTTAKLSDYQGNCQWSCIASACSTNVAACDIDCPCNGAVLQALACSADGGTAVACFSVALVDGTAAGLLTCLQQANAQCASCGDAGGGD